LENCGLECRQGKDNDKLITWGYVCQAVKCCFIMPNSWLPLNLCAGYGFSTRGLHATLQGVSCGLPTFLCNTASLCVMEIGCTLLERALSITCVRQHVSLGDEREFSIGGVLQMNTWTEACSLHNGN
jgi:hypothetical protein